MSDPMIDRLTAERDSLRAALEEFCRCRHCKGSGMIDVHATSDPCHYRAVCGYCAGTGRNYHGSEAAKRLLEGGR